MSCYISSGCNNQPCSQSQKVSIGIVVDSVAKSRRNFMKDAQNHSDQRRVKATTTMTKCGNDVEGSVRVTTASFGNKLEMKRSGYGVNPASRPASSSLYVEKPTRITQSFTNQAMPECGVGNKTEGDPTSEKENERVFMEDKAQKFSGAPKQQVCCEGKEMEDRSRETLRMKLREILGTGDKIFGHPRTPEVEVNVMTKKETEKGKTNFKPWQNSDTIETDSENADLMIRKPVTRSLTRRATLAKKQPINIKTKSISREKGHVRANIFSFAEKSAISTPCPVKRVCLIAEKIDSKQSFGINAWGKLFPVKNSRNIMPEMNGYENAQPAEELGGGGIKPSKYAGLDGNFEPEDAYQDLTSGHSPVARETSQFPLPAPQGKLEHLEPKSDQFRVHNVDDLNQSPVQNAADLNHSPVHNVDKLNQFPVHNVDDFHSPVQNVTDLNHSTVHNVNKLKQFPVHIVDDLNQSPVQNVTDLNHSPVHNVDDLNQSPVHHVNNSNSQRFTVTKNALYSPMYPLTNDKKGFHESIQQEGGAGLKAKCCTPSTSSETEISECSDDADKLEDSPSSTLNPSSEENNAGNRLCTPMRRELDSTEEVSSAMKEIDDVHTSPEIRFVGKHMLFQRKRQRNHGVESDDLSPTLTPKLSGYVDDELLCCEETQEDGMQRVVSLLGLALEKIQNKMMSVTNRKCSEILVSAAEEIHSELQSVDSQIQTDLGKLTDIKTAKRKQLETRLQEQTEHLKAMHDKFKEEICEYLHDCQGAMEGMKEYHFELQRAIKKQKTLHRKLLLQTEAAVETRLSDAQRQMKIVRKLGKQKIQQLQVVIAECLKDQITY